MTTGQGSGLTSSMLSRVLRGEEVDWLGATIPAAEVAAAIRKAHSSRLAITFTNARIDGDLLLDGVGEVSEPVRLQMLNCIVVGDFRARSARWRQLLIAKCQLRCIDLRSNHIDGDLAIELTRCSGWVELRSSKVGRDLALNSSHFTQGDHDAAVNLSDAAVEGNLYARDLRVNGSIRGRGLRVVGDASFDAASIDGRGTHPSLALDLSRSLVGGRVRLCQGDDGRFVARGRVHLDNAVIGQLDCKAALLDGDGYPAMIADQVEIRGHADFSGLSDQNGDPFEAIGTIRLSAATIAHQVQIYDAKISGAEHALMMVGARLGGDFLLGHAKRKTELRGMLCADDLRIAGRLMFHDVEASGGETAISLRQCRIDGEANFHTVTVSGPMRFDYCHAHGLSFENVTLTQSRPMISRQGFPEHYAHAEDCLLELNFIRLPSDLRIEAVHVEGGDIRMIGAKIDGGLQMSRVRIRNVPDLALIAQGAEFGADVRIAGSPDGASDIEGEVQFLGVTVRGDITLAGIVIGTADNPAALTLHGAHVAGGVTLIHTTIHGCIRAGSARIAGDFFVHSSSLINPGQVVCDLRGTRVGGKLQFATATRSEPINCRIDGQIEADGAEAATLGWARVALADKGLLCFTNMRVSRQIDAGPLFAEGEGGINLSGTSVPLLIDKIDNEEDSWGAGKIILGLDNFAYDRLQFPSGRSSDAPRDVRLWRSKWLNRRNAGSARPPRHLATVLRNQGLFEASRQVLIDAFSAEGEMRPTWIGRFVSRQFGAWFGYGLSGARAFFTLMNVWLIGNLFVIGLVNSDLLVAEDNGKTISCGSRIDPTIYSADAMLPVLDLGEETKCRIGSGSKAEPWRGRTIGKWEILGEVETVRFIWAVYNVLGWTVVSLAIATWSGLFRRGGRE